MDTQQHTEQYQWQNFKVALEDSVLNTQVGDIAPVKLTRRDFLRGMAVTIAGYILPACGDFSDPSAEGNNSQESQESISLEISTRAIKDSYHYLCRTKEADIKWLPQVVDKYWPIFTDKGKLYGVEPGLLAIISLYEAGLDHTALSSQNAQGLMQITPGTYDLMMKHLRTREEDKNESIPTDPIELNITMAALLISIQTEYYQDRAGGDLAQLLHYVIWDYHDGQSSVDEGIYRNGTLDEIKYISQMWSEKDLNDSEAFQELWKLGKYYWISNEVQSQQVQNRNVCLIEERSESQTGQSNGNNPSVQNVSGIPTESSPSQYKKIQQINGSFSDPDRNLIAEVVGESLKLTVNGQLYIIELLRNKKNKVSMFKVHFPDGSTKKRDLNFTTPEGISVSYKGKKESWWINR